MSKEIIVNGVDVSGCEKQGETVAGITCGNGERIRLANEIITKHTLCKDNPNCIYKQLKRKEQECEKWKSYYELYQINNDSLKKVHAVINDNPKYGIELTENGTLDKDERLSYLEIHEQVKLIIDEQAKEIDLLNAENERLKQSLIEIETIAGEAKTACESCSERYTDCTGYKDFENEGDCTHCGIGARASLAKQVLQKVSEREVKMPNEIEKQFFDTFGIEPKFKTFAIKRDKQGEFTYPPIYEYPQITDRILLELICIKNKELISIVQVRGNNLEELKSYILQTWAHWYTYYSSLPVHKERADNFKRRVRALFEEE